MVGQAIGLTGIAEPQSVETNEQRQVDDFIDRQGPNRPGGSLSRRRRLREGQGGRRRAHLRCARYGDVTAVRLLLKHGEELSSLGPDLGLGFAAFCGYWKLCQYLIECGADPNHADPETGETALHSALCKPNRPAFDLVVQVLLDAGADPNHPTRPDVPTGGFMRDCRTRGETPLHRAAAFGSEAAIRRLIDAGAKVDAKDMNGDSPLGWASWHTRPDAILRLLCYAEHRIHPERNSTFDHGRGWGFARRPAAARRVDITRQPRHGRLLPVPPAPFLSLIRRPR